jgi:carbon-monoxide dehydrogenase large subunit
MVLCYKVYIPRQRSNVDVTATLPIQTAVDAYRGADRPEATYLLERLIDLARLEMNVDPAELRFQKFHSAI